MPIQSYGTKGLGEYQVQVQTGLTADSGSVQAGATPLIEGVNVVATVATIGDSLLLPKAGGNIGMVCEVHNTAANSADVFPRSGEDAGAGADTAVAVAGGASALFRCVGEGAWQAILGA